MTSWIQAARGFLPDSIWEAVNAISDDELGQAEEMRFRAERAGVLVTRTARHSLPVLNVADMQRFIAQLSRRSLYALEQQLSQGYIPLGAGFRAGVCGRTVIDGNAVRSMQEISGICIRIAREVIGAATDVMPYIIEEKPLRVRSTLIMSAPGLGKTTLLRDAVRQISGRGVDVAVADERSEIAASYMGCPQLDVGPDTDVLDACPKRLALPMLIRTMRPAVIATDEIGDPADAASIQDAARCGVAILATAHGGALTDLKSRPAMNALLQNGTFERIVLLNTRPGNISAIYNEKGERI